MGGRDALRVAQTVRAACVRAAIEAYERAGMDGLCAEGAWEAAIEAIRGVDLDRLLNDHQEFPI
jgi:hypothetical protein